MQTSFLNPLYIPAGDIRAIEVYGAAFYLVSAPIDVVIRADQTAAKSYKQGQGEDMPAGQTFRRLEVHNPSKAAVWIKLWAGFGKFVDNRVAIQEAPSCFIAQAVEKLTPYQHWPLPGIASGNLSQRKAVIVSNLDPAALIFVKDAASTRGAPVFPGHSIRLAVSGPVVVENPNGQQIDCYIAEEWYGEITPPAPSE